MNAFEMIKVLSDKRNAHPRMSGLNMLDFELVRDVERNAKTKRRIQLLTTPIGPTSSFEKLLNFHIGG